VLPSDRFVKNSSRALLISRITPAAGTLILFDACMPATIAAMGTADLPRKNDCSAVASVVRLIRRCSSPVRLDTISSARLHPQSNRR